MVNPKFPIFAVAALLGAAKYLHHGDREL